MSGSELYQHELEQPRGRGLPGASTSVDYPSSHSV
jgi:hypothetical protein